MFIFFVVVLQTLTRAVKLKQVLHIAMSRLHHEAVGQTRRCDRGHGDSVTDDGDVEGKGKGRSCELEWHTCARARTHTRARERTRTCLHK